METLQQHSLDPSLGPPPRSGAWQGAPPADRAAPFAPKLPLGHGPFSSGLLVLFSLLGVPVEAEMRHRLLWVSREMVPRVCRASRARTHRTRPPERAPCCRRDGDVHSAEGSLRHAGRGRRGAADAVREAGGRPGSAPPRRRGSRRLPGPGW